MNFLFGFFFYGMSFIILTVFQSKGAKISSNSNAEVIFRIVLIIRIIIYLFLILTGSTMYGIMPIDVVFTFVLLFSSVGHASNIEFSPVTQSVIRCPRCNALINTGDKFCGECGSNLTLVENPATVEPIYQKSEKVILEELITECANRNGYNINATLPEMKKRKIIISVICGLISFILTSLVFFHISFLIILLDIVNTIVYFIIINNFNTMKYLIKEIKSRPDEDLEYVVSNVLSNVSTFRYSKLIYVSVILISIIVPLFIFSKPHYFYEFTKEGYYLRFYTTGFESEKNITIPETYKGKKVIGIRGNVFMNLKNLKSVTLPDTIEVIRGHAFDGDSSLESINLPSSLKYLGGGAFKDCRKLKEINIPISLKEINGSTFENSGIESIELPDTITNIGGSAFKDCRNLKTIKLPKIIREIHGNTFENCTSLESITIPDAVTRIGGHAFYNNSSLSNVSLSENSLLAEIGSSAFRLCNNLSSIVLPKSAVNINERAFKESPTKIYYYGEVMYGMMVDESKFDHKSYAYLHVGEEEVIGKYQEDSISHNDKLILSNITVNQDKVVYSIKYIGKHDSKTFTIDSEVPYAYVNDNLAVEIDSKYAATRPNALSFDVYYN